MLIRTGYLLSMDAPPLRHAALRVCGDRIVAMSNDLRPEPQEEVLDLREYVVAPGLINAHAHLDLSVERPLPAAPFPEWVPQLKALRDIPLATLQSRIAYGIQQSLASGVTTVGDYIGDLRALPQLAAGPLKGRGLIECIANSITRADALTQSITDALAAVPSPSALTFTLTPHTFFSNIPEVLQRFLRPTTPRKGPLAIHCAESAEEMEYFRSGGGSLAAMLHDYGFPPIAPVASPIAYAQRHGGLPRHACLIHCNYLSDDDIAAIRAAECRVVHCPQSHAYFDHAPFPLERLQAAGVPVALGTDSLASGQTLNMLTCLRQMREKFPMLTAAQVLAMATTTSARALALDGGAGRLAVGGHADWFAVPIGRTGDDPYVQVLRSPQAHYVMCNGVMHRRPT